MLTFHLMAKTTDNSHHCSNKAEELITAAAGEFDER
jgi:hypothetical protein